MKAMRMASLRIRLLVGAAAFVLLALSAVGWSLEQLFARHVAREHQMRLVATADTIAANLVRQVKSDGNIGISVTREPSDPRFDLPGSGEYWQVSGAAEAVRSRSLWDSGLDVQSSKPFGHGSQLIRFDGPFDETLMVLVQPVVIGEDTQQVSATIVVATNEKQFSTARAEFSNSLLIMLAVTGLALVVASLAQIHFGLAPLDRLRIRVGEIRAGGRKSLEEDGPRETAALVASINSLLEARDADITKARERAADLAHGLKTPLTILAHIADRLAKGRSGKIAGQMGEQVVAIRQRVDRQLALTRMAAGASSCNASVIAGKLVSLMRQISVSGTAAPLHWKFNAPPVLEVVCDAVDYSEILGNVLDNARKWAASEVAVQILNQGKEIVTLVEDDGPGVEEDAMPKILQRGGHLDTQASETGLGLSIAREIAEAHGGGLLLGRATAGGLQVVLTLPKR